MSEIVFRVSSNMDRNVFVFQSGYRLVIIDKLILINFGQDSLFFRLWDQAMNWILFLIVFGSNFEFFLWLCTWSLFLLSFILMFSRCWYDIMRVFWCWIRLILSRWVIKMMWFYNRFVDAWNDWWCGVVLHPLTGSWLGICWNFCLENCWNRWINQMRGFWWLPFWWVNAFNFYKVVIFRSKLILNVF